MTAPSATAAPSPTAVDPNAIRALIVDAKDQTARRFYEHFGFRRLRDRHLALYLPLGR